MNNEVSREEIIAIGVAHAISRSEQLEGFDGLSILMEYREWICDDPIKDNVWTVDYLGVNNESEDSYKRSIKNWQSTFSPGNKNDQI